MIRSACRRVVGASIGLFACVAVMGQAGSEPPPPTLYCTQDVCFEFDCLKVGISCRKYGRTTALRHRSYWGVGASLSVTTTKTVTTVFEVATCTKSCLGKTYSQAANCGGDELDRLPDAYVAFCDDNMP
jgi:hypothetical protein